MTHLQLYQQINLLPQHLNVEVAKFIEFLLYKQKEPQTPKKRKFGFAKGKIKMSPDFDAPLEELNEYMP